MPEMPTGSPTWLVIVLFVLFGTPAVFSKVAARLPGVFGATGRWWQSRREPEIRREADRAASYRVQAAEIARLSEQYERLKEDWSQQNTRIDSVELNLAEAQDRLTATNRRFFALVQYARNLVVDIQRIDPEHVIREAPDALKEYL